MNVQIKKFVEKKFEKSTIQSRSKSISNGQKVAYFGQIYGMNQIVRTTAYDNQPENNEQINNHIVNDQNSINFQQNFQQNTSLEQKQEQQETNSKTVNQNQKTFDQQLVQQQKFIQKNDNKYSPHNSFIYHNPKFEAKLKPKKQVEKFYCIFPGNGLYILRAAMQKKKGWKELPKEMAFSGKCNFIWRPTNFNYKEYCQIDQILHKGLLAQEKAMNSAYQPLSSQSYIDFDPSKELVVNHLENNREITTKTGLIRSLKMYYKDNQNSIENCYQVFDTTPTTFVVSSNLDTYEYHQFVKRYQDLKKNFGQTLKERMPAKHCQLNTWMVKPANENQGKEKPLLYHGRKFDIRVWAVSLSNQDFYFCNTGYVRTSSFKYTQDVQNEYVHLTNNCLQMLDQKNYGKHEQGNTLPFSEFQNYLNENFGEYNLQFEKDFLMRMKDIAIDCFLSAKSSMNPSKRRNSFEFFGFDFMIDEDFRVWLIEVNTNPYVGIHNDSMSDVLPRMLHGLYKIVLDPVFEHLSQEEIENISVGTDWDILYSRVKSINKRRSINEGIYPVSKLQQKKEMPARFQKSRSPLKEQVSPWIDEQKKMKKQNEDKKKLLNELEQNILQKNQKIKPVKINQTLKQSQSVAFIETKDQQLSNVFNQENKSGIESPDLQKRTAARPFEARSASVSRISIAKEITFKNQQNFIPQPNLKMAAVKKFKFQNQNEDLQQLYKYNSENKRSFNESDLKNYEKIQEVSSADQNQSPKEENKTPREQSQLIKNEHQSQGETSNPAQFEFEIGLKPEKTIVAQVKKLDSRSKFYKIKCSEIMNRIVSTMISWELFSDEQLQDANMALKILQQSFIQNPEDQKPMIRSLIRLVGSNEVPMHIRYQIAINVYLMLKNKIFKRIFIQDPIETHTTLRPIYQLLLESQIQEEQYKDNEYIQELYYECVNILILIMSLNNIKYHIPGETYERNRIRQKAQEAGILIIVVYIMMKTKNKLLYQYIEEEFFKKIEEQDIEFHFENYHSHYAIAQDIIIDSKDRQSIDQILGERVVIIKDFRQKEEKMLIELRKKELWKEQQQKREQDEALKIKRQEAQEKVEQRLKELQKTQAEQLKKEIEMKQEQEKQEIERKRQQQEEFKKKMEMRKQKQKEQLELQIKTEIEIQEEIERMNREREIAKRIALQQWHRQKKEEERRKKIFDRPRIRASERHNSHLSYKQSQLRVFKEYDKAQQLKASSIFKAKLDFLTEIENNLKIDIHKKQYNDPRQKQIDEIINSQIALLEGQINPMQSGIHSPGSPKSSQLLNRKFENAEGAEIKNLSEYYKMLKQKPVNSKTLNNTIEMSESKNSVNNIISFLRPEQFSQLEQKNLNFRNSQIINEEQYSKTENDVASLEKGQNKKENGIRTCSQDVYPMKIQNQSNTLDHQEISYSQNQFGMKLEKKESISHQSFQDRILPQINQNQNQRVFIPVPTSITIINNDNSINNYNQYFINKKKKQNLEQTDEDLAKKILRGGKNIEFQQINQQTEIMSQSFNKPTSPNKKQNHFSYQQLLSQRIKEVPNFGKFKNGFRMKDENKHNHLFEGYSISNNKDSAIKSDHKITDIQNFVNQSVDELNFPQILNLKTDLEDILQKRASYIQNAYKKEKISQIYGINKKKTIIN